MAETEANEYVRFYQVSMSIEEYEAIEAMPPNRQNDLQAMAQRYLTGAAYRLHGRFVRRSEDDSSLPA